MATVPATVLRGLWITRDLTGVSVTRWLTTPSHDQDGSLAGPSVPPVAEIVAGLRAVVETAGPVAAAVTRGRLVLTPLGMGEWRRVLKAAKAAFPGADLQGGRDADVGDRVCVWWTGR